MIRRNVAILGGLLVIGPVQAKDGVLSQAVVETCIAEVHRTSSDSSFDAYLEPGSGGAFRMIGTVRDRFNFGKCLAKHGLSLGDQ